jgi:hypothetical protein
MVRDGSYIRLRSGAHGGVLFCGRRNYKGGDRYSAADGRNNDGKKSQPLDDQWLSLLRHRAGAKPTGFPSERS